MPSQLKDVLDSNFTYLHTLHPVYIYLTLILFANKIDNNDYRTHQTVFFFGH